MPGKKIIARLISVICALLLILVIFLSAVEFRAFDLKFFEAEYKKLATAQTIGISEKDLMNTTVQLLAYIKGERSDLNIEAEIKGKKQQVFNQREIDHMVDVQKLYKNAYMVRIQALIFLVFLLGLLLAQTGNGFPQVWATGYLFGTGLFALFAGLAAWEIQKDFFTFWNNFHYIVFTNDLWILDPQKDILIQIVPEQFFFDLVAKILVTAGIAVAALAILAAGIFLRERKKKHDKI